jgi:hypothetical protein
MGARGFGLFISFFVAWRPDAFVKKSPKMQPNLYFAQN